MLHFRSIGGRMSDQQIADMLEQITMLRLTVEELAAAVGAVPKVAPASDRTPEEQAIYAAAYVAYLFEGMRQCYKPSKEWWAKTSVHHAEEAVTLHRAAIK